jgi:ParB/RepB/Spo0J family partition protein
MREVYDENKVYNLPMGDVFADESFNSRGKIEPLKVMELAREIATNGLLQPITVQTYDRMPGKKFRIIAGYRRYAAHQLNQAQTIRSLVKNEISDLDARLLNLSENTQRENLNILQEANAIQHFVLAGWSEQQIGTRLGKSRGWVQVRVMLLQLPNEIQEEAAFGMVSQEVIRELYTMAWMGYGAQIEHFKKVKDAKLLGKKRKPKPMDAYLTNERKARSQEEIGDMQDEIIDTINRNVDPLTKALAWAGGFIDDKEFHEYLVQYIRKTYNRHWIIPEQIQKAETLVKV